MSLLKNKRLAIDADILLRKVQADPVKSLQEGHAALDMTMQRNLAQMMNRLKKHFEIDLVVVIDGLIPRCVADYESIVDRSR